MTPIMHARMDIGYASQYSCTTCRGQFLLLRGIGMLRTGSATRNLHDQTASQLQIGSDAAVVWRSLPISRTRKK